MGCIIPGKGVKTRWSHTTLCGKKTTLQNITEFYAGKVNCLVCLIRQDAMFARGYEQKKYTVWYNSDGRYNMVLFNEYHSDSFRRYEVSIPIHAKFIDGILMWDADTIKGAIKLSKMGIHGMGLAKEER